MKILTTTLLAGSAFLFTAGGAGAQVKTIEGEMISTTVTVEAIEQQSRTLTVKDDKGIYETIHVPADVTRFPEIKVGDKITARYYDNVVVRLKKPGEAAVDLDTAALTRGKGARPAGTAATQRTITATVTAMDVNAETITVSGPNGWHYSRKVDDKKALAQLKVGDKLDMTWTEAVMVSVAPSK